MLIFDFILDIKYTDQGVKILEFGSIYNSNFGPDKASQQALMDQLDNVLKQTGLLAVSTKEVFNNYRELPRDLYIPFAAENANAARKFSAIHLRKQSEPFCNLSDRTKLLMVGRSPNFMMSWVDKTVMQAIFEHAEQTHARPKSCIYPLDDDEKLIEKIESDFQDTNTDTLVFKAAISTHGFGVFPISKKELRHTLTILLCGLSEEKIQQATTQYRKAYKKHLTPEVIDENLKAAQVWRERAASTSCFMVEEFCTSCELIEINEQKYDPKMRVALVVICDSDKKKDRVFPLDCYWKLPAKSIEDKTASLNRQLITKAEDGGYTFQSVDKKTKDKVFEELTRIMPTITRALVDFDMLSYITSQMKLNVNLGVERTIAYVDVLIERHYYQKAINLLKPIIDNPPNPIRRIQALKCAAIAYFRAGLTDKAKKSVEVAIAESSAYPQNAPLIVSLRSLFDLINYYLNVRASGENDLIRFFLDNTNNDDLVKSLKYTLHTNFELDSIKEILGIDDKSMKTSLSTSRGLVLNEKGLMHRQLKAEVEFFLEKHNLKSKLLNLSQLLDRSEDHKYEKALRMICNYPQTQIALELAKILLKYQKIFEINVNHIPENSTPDKRKAAMHYAVIQNNDELFVLLKDSFAPILIYRTGRAIRQRRLENKNKQNVTCPDFIFQNKVKI